jgi:cold-inducible RNA-binding protein
MGNRLYVGNLAFGTTKEALEATFVSAGEVREVQLPTDRDTGKLRGFAFVTMGSDAAAADAITKLDGRMLDGRPLRVNEAQERPQRGGFGRDARGSGSSRR